MYNKIIYLTGFMTSGKSTIGPILANVLGWNYFDLDAEIEKDTGLTVDEIFEKNGEEYFRKLESHKLESLSGNTECVISLGGGAVVNDNNINLIKKTGKLIYLKSSPETIYKRIKNKLDRPIFKDLITENKPKEEFLKRINDLLGKREKYYNAADLTIDTNSNNLGRTVDFIANKINKM
ncbi:MAG: shikimate kinase [Melioribacteraceae bacterium]|nr:shikimate kinase [Melioribacteraceae bacterium]